MRIMRSMRLNLVIMREQVRNLSEILQIDAYKIIRIGKKHIKKIIGGIF